MNGLADSGPADNPVSAKGIQTLTAVFPHYERLTELKSHLLVLGDDVGLNDDHHVLPKDHFITFVAARRAALNDGRVLVGAVNQVVVDAVSPAMDDFREFGGHNTDFVMADKKRVRKK